MEIGISYRIFPDQDSISFSPSIPSRFMRYIKNDHVLGYILSVVKHFFLQGMGWGGQKVMVQQLFIQKFQIRGTLRLFQFLSQLRSLI